MSKPEKQHVDATDAHNGVRAKADVVRGTGPDAELVIKAKGSAGEDFSPQPSRLGDSVAAGDVLSVPEAFVLLRDTVASMEHRGSSTAAAGVAAFMIKADPRFNPRATPFGTFRRFLEAAADRNAVSLSSTPGGSDVVVTLPDGDIAPVVSVPPPARRWLRPDLWRALVTGESRGLYAFDRRTRATRYWPQGLSPENESGHVPVLPIPNEQQLSWMRAFADRERDGEVREALQVALGDTDGPAQAFKEAVRARESLSRRWGRHLRALVMATAEDWARSNGIELADIVRDERGEGRSAGPNTASGSAPAARTDVARRRDGGAAEALGTLPEGASVFGAGGRATDGALSDDLEVRRKILAALASMPLGELLRLPIPAEYLLRR